MSANPYWIAGSGTMLRISWGLMAYWGFEHDEGQQQHHRDEMQLIIGAPKPASMRLFRAGSTIEGASGRRISQLGSVWLTRGNYFVRCDRTGASDSYPAAASGCGSGPEPPGAVRATILHYPTEGPLRPPAGRTDFVLIRSGHFGETKRSYRPNRHGLYRMSGKVAEGTQSVFRPYGRQPPYEEADGNHDGTNGRPTVRGGWWYSATIAPQHLPCRDAFQPDHANNDVGFRVAARRP